MADQAARDIATLKGEVAAKVARDCLHRPKGSGTSEQLVLLAVAVHDAAEAAELSDVLHVLRNHQLHGRGTREEVLRALLPAQRLTMSPEVLEQVQRNAEAQVELADEFELLSSSAVAELAGSTASNRAATANRWSTAHRVFTVDVEGAQRFPGFQFDENGKPLPVIADVLAAVGDRLTGWELALWFTSSNDWLGELRPVDVLDSDPERVVEAAARLADEILA
jgi:hypothetical protein